MFDTPYQTTATARHLLSKVTEPVRTLEINEELVPAQGSVTGVRFVPPGHVKAEPFQQPLTSVEIPTLTGGVVIDGRSLLRPDLRPVREDAYQHEVMVGDLTSLWLLNERAFRLDMLNVGEFPAKVFSRWISNSLINKLSLDAIQVAKIRALVIVYYIQLFNPLSENATDEDQIKILTRASRYIGGIDSTTLGMLVGKIPVLNDLQDLVTWIKTSMDSARTDKLTVGLLYDVIGYSFGERYKEAVCIALEYPPIFMALVYKTCVERSFTRSGLGRIIETVVSRGNDKEYVKEIVHLLRAR